MNEPRHPLPLRVRLSGHHFVYLLASMFLLFAVHPFIAAQNQAAGRFALNILFLIMLLASLHAVAVNKRIRIVGWAVVIPAILLRWSGYFMASQVLTRMAHAVDLLFFIYIVMILLHHVMRSESVTVDKLMAALAVYLLIGLVFANLYFLIEAIYPAAFEVPQYIRDMEGYARGDMHPMSKFIYFSFVTISTLGYGDITPSMPATQSFSAMEAIIGQFYLTVLIARLVGLHITQHMREHR